MTNNYHTQALLLTVGAATFKANRKRINIAGDPLGNSITTITGACAYNGCTVVLHFEDTLITIVDDDGFGADTIDMDGDFISSVGATLTLYHDGTSWHQQAKGKSEQDNKQIITLAAAATTFAATGKLVVMTGDAGENTLATITGASAFAGNAITIRFEDSLVTITDNQSHTTGSVALHRDFIGSPDGTLILQHDGISWYEVDRSCRAIESITLGSGVTTFDATASTILLTGNAGVQPDIDTIGGPRAVGGEDIYIFFQDALANMSEIAEAANTLRLSADFTAADDMVIHFHHDGVKWYEIVKTGT